MLLLLQINQSCPNEKETLLVAYRCPLLEFDGDVIWIRLNKQFECWISRLKRSSDSDVLTGEQ